MDCRKDGGGREKASKKEEVGIEKMEKLGKLEKGKEININRK